MYTSTYATANLYNKYKNDSVNTASPVELIIMLYDGCVKNIKIAKLHLEENNIEQASASLIKAQDIVDELIRSLDMSYPISEELMRLYDFISYELVQINVTKDMNRADPLIEILLELKSAWTEVKAADNKTYYAGDE